jgi:hypothetical protein
MSRTITAWAVVDECTGEVIYLRRDEDRDLATDLAMNVDDFTVVELTGELPDPAKTVTLDGLTWTKETAEWNTPSGQWCTVTSRMGVLLDRIWELEQQIGGAS